VLSSEKDPEDVFSIIQSEHLIRITCLSRKRGEIRPLVLCCFSPARNEDFQQGSTRCRPPSKGHEADCEDRRIEIAHNIGNVNLAV
jgi:hypothetical protein